MDRFISLSKGNCFPRVKVGHRSEEVSRVLLVRRETGRFLVLVRRETVAGTFTRVLAFSVRKCAVEPSIIIVATGPRHCIGTGLIVL